MKFRELFSKMIAKSALFPVVIMIGSYSLVPKMFGLYVNRRVFYRLLKWNVAMITTFLSWTILNAYPWSDKTLHEVLTQPEPNGKYVRALLKDNYPRHWAMISKDLHDLGYNFKEMNEYSENIYMPDVTYKWDASRY